MLLNSPAGSLRAARTALNNGADSVYVGLADVAHQRQQCKNLTLEELQTLQSEALAAGRRVWVTLNSSYTDEQWPAVMAKAQILADSGVYGAIVADFGLLRALRQRFPQWQLLFSVQGQVANRGAAKAIASWGANRVVLDRDTTITEAAQIRALSGLEVELFAFGYMCNARDSVCYMGDHWSGSPCNVHCAQKTRFLSGPPARGAEGTGRDERWLFMKFYSALRYIPQLLDAPIDALKIEGRHRSSRFVAATTAVFRDAIDTARRRQTDGSPYVVDPAWTKELSRQAFGFEVTDGRYVDGDYHRDVATDPDPQTMWHFAVDTLDNALETGNLQTAVKQLIGGASRHLTPPVRDATGTHRSALP